MLKGGEVMKVNELGQALGFNNSKGNYYINKGGYLLSLVQGDNGICLLASVFDRTITKADEKIFKLAKKSNGLRSLHILNDTVVLILPFAFKVNEKVLEKINVVIDEFVAAASEAGLEQSKKCVICGEETEEVNAINGLFEYAHDECTNNLKENLLKQIDNEMNTNTERGKSIIFSLSMALIGIIPTIIVLFLFSYIFGLLFAIPPMAAFWGYKKGGAVLDKVATTCAVAFSFLATLMVSFMYVSTVSTLGEISFAESVSLCIPDIVSFVIFWGLGILISVKYISNTINKRRKDIEKL